MSRLSPRSSPEDGRGQTGHPGFFREADGAGASEAELDEGDASPPPSPPILRQRPPISRDQLRNLLQPLARSDNRW